jgi:hypothetical protein
VARWQLLVPRMPISTVPSQAAIGYQLFELFAMSLSSQHKVSSSIVWDYAAPLRGLGHVGFRCLRRRRRWHHSALRRHDVDGAEQRHDSISARSVGRRARIGLRSRRRQHNSSLRRDELDCTARRRINGYFWSLGHIGDQRLRGGRAEVGGTAPSLLVRGPPAAWRGSRARSPGRS